MNNNWTLCHEWVNATTGEIVRVTRTTGYPARFSLSMGIQRTDESVSPFIPVPTRENGGIEPVDFGWLHDQLEMAAHLINQEVEREEREAAQEKIKREQAPAAKPPAARSHQQHQVMRKGKTERDRQRRLAKRGEAA